jgi:hypothetical protein
LLHRLSLLIAHLLKWKAQPERQSRSWELTIRVQRKDLAKLLSENPSPPGTQQLGIPHGPLVIIALVEFSRAHNPIIDRYRDFNCSGSTA